MQTVQVGQKYRHFKGKEYVIIALAQDSETTEEVVVYQAQYDSPEFGPKQTWVRPLSNFCEKKEVGGKQVDRFSLISD